MQDYIAVIKQNFKLLKRGGKSFIPDWIFLWCHVEATLEGRVDAATLACLPSGVVGEGRDF